MNIEIGFDEFFTKRHGELPVDTTSEKYADMSYLKHEMKKAWEMATASANTHSCVMVPVQSLRIALRWMHEDVNAAYMSNEEFKEMFEHKPVLEKILVETARGGK